MEETRNNGDMSDKKLLDLLTDLAQIQTEIAILDARIFAREGKEQVEEKAAEISESIQEKAKMYGKKAQALAEEYSRNSEQRGSIIQEYTQALFEINEEYAKRMKTIMVEKQDLQTEEQETYCEEKRLRLENKKIKKSPEYLQYEEQEKNLTSEIKRALAKGDLQTVTQKTEELKALKAKNPLTINENQIGEVQARREEIAQLIKECEENLEACKDERHDKIEEITSDKNNQLAVIPKQNIVQKIFGNLFNKLNGLAKFKDSVIANITEKIETIKTEQLPAVKEAVQEKSEQFLEEMQNRREQIKQKALETRDAVTDKVAVARDTVVEKVTDARDAVVDKVKGARDTVVQGIQDIRTTVQDRANQTFTSIINRGKQAKESVKIRLQQSLEKARTIQEEKQARLAVNSDKIPKPIEGETGRE